MSRNVIGGKMLWKAAIGFRGLGYRTGLGYGGAEG
jgi:hypothetical protein